MSFLCLKRDIQEGEYNVFSVFDDEVIAKNDNGKITVAKNSCKHRGFKVASCAGRGPIKCGYHGQRFEYEQKYTHYEFGEFVFVPKFLQSSEQLKEISPKLGHEFGSISQYVVAPFHLWMQNTADPNHLKTAHKESFSKLFDGTRPENVYISEFESSYTMRIEDEVVERYRKHFPECTDHFTHILGFPNLSVTSFLDVFLSVESVSPLLDGCMVTTRFFTNSAHERNTLLERMALEENRKILDEDKALVEKWAKGYSYDPEKVKWLPGEERIRRYADEIRARNLD